MVSSASGLGGGHLKIQDGNFHKLKNADTLNCMSNGVVTHCTNLLYPERGKNHSFFDVHMV